MRTGPASPQCPSSRPKVSRAPLRKRAKRLETFPAFTLLSQPAPSLLPADTRSEDLFTKCPWSTHQAGPAPRTEGPVQGPAFRQVGEGGPRDLSAPLQVLLPAGLRAQQSTGTTVSWSPLVRIPRFFLCILANNLTPIRHC